VTAAIARLNRRTFASLQQYPNYRLFFGGQVVSVTGSWMQNIASGWLIITLTHSPVAVGVLALAQFLPFTIFGLFAGVIVDRFDNRKLIIGTQAVQMVLAAALAAIALGGVAVPWMVYVIAFLRGSVLVLDVPARQSLTYRMVGPAELPNAIALNSSLFNASRVIGPALGGLVIAAVGLGFCFVSNAVSFLAVLASLLLMDERKLFPVVRAKVPPTILRGTREGLAFALRNRRVLVTLAIVAMVSTFSFNLNVILPVLASTTLHAGPQTFGLISACFGAGALIGALVSASVGRASWKIVTLGTGLFGLTELLLAPERSVWAAGLLLIVLGAAFTTWTSNANSGVQLEAPDHLRGRVVGLYFYAFNGAAPLGGLLVGWLSAMGGTELALAVGGIVALVMTAVGVVALRDEPARPEPLVERVEPTALAA
jgi:MFS family permease